jgi:hypothetical protein
MSEDGSAPMVSETGGLIMSKKTIEEPKAAGRAKVIGVPSLGG